MTDLDDILKEFKEDLEIAARAVMVKRGVDKNSDLVKTLEFKEKGDIFEMIVNDYYLYVDTGRRSGSAPPINAILQWMRDKRINPRGRMTRNSLAFAIVTSIKKFGIAGKKYGDEVEEVVADVSEIKMADGLEEIIVSQIDEILK